METGTGCRAVYYGVEGKAGGSDLVSVAHCGG